MKNSIYERIFKMYAALDIQSLMNSIILLMNKSKYEKKNEL